MSEFADAGVTATRGPGEGRVSRLVCRLYRGADPAARAGMLATLMRPLGPLGLAAVASGAFAGFVTRRRGVVVDIGADEVSRFSIEQVHELARFVEQVDAGTLQQLMAQVVASPNGFSAFGAAAALLALRWSSGRARPR